ncbi:hypothetical protein [Methylobacterium variabile]|uniref:hypothetical protein n=1 Tax=Methylobacterium variabile TaxID=298794 RepID=UPI0012ED2DB8|nr:hypothetical protein [Methylobacterium variabile]
MDLAIRKATTKTGAFAAHDLKLCPIVLEMVKHVPADRRVGLLIINEATGKPYAEWVFTQEWRKVAQAAGIPDEVRNMDARAGAITEGDEASADLESLKTVAAHATTSTTARYVRGGRGKSCAAAKLPLKHRESQNGA